MKSNELWSVFLVLLVGIFVLFVTRPNEKEWRAYADSEIGATGLLKAWWHDQEFELDHWVIMDRLVVKNKDGTKEVVAIGIARRIYAVK